jgi:hypothetical protein
MIPTMVRSAPADGAEAVSQLLPGEEFAVLDITAGWAWGYCRLDRRVGYVEAIELAEPLNPTHIVIEAQAPVQSGGDPLAPALSFLPMGSRLHGQVKGAMLEFEGGFIPLSYLRPIGEHEEDPVNVARRLMGALYLQGGRTLHGVDCSGLVQLSLQLCGIDCPRDTDHQRSLGEAVPEGSPLRRGDLLFCEDHVGLMVDDRRALHLRPAARKRRRPRAAPPAAVGPRYPSWSARPTPSPSRLRATNSQFTRLLTTASTNFGRALR